MVSRGIIVDKRKVDTAKSNKNIYEYKVRVPFIHGVNQSNGGVTNSDLPWATYCPLPGSEATELNINDGVYVAIVDFDFSDLAILGLIPSTSSSSTIADELGGKLISSNIKGMANSSSQLLLDNVNMNNINTDAIVTMNKLFSITDGNKRVNWNAFLRLLSQPIIALARDNKLSPNYGGTGASSIPDFLNSNNLSKVEVIDENAFKKKINTKKLTNNTLYFIYLAEDVEGI